MTTGLLKGVSDWLYRYACDGKKGLNDSDGVHMQKIRLLGLINGLSGPVLLSINSKIVNLDRDSNGSSAVVEKN